MHVFGDQLTALVQIDAKHRAAQRLHGDPAALHVEVDFTSVTPAVDECLCRPGHVAAEIPHVLFGEHRLQGTLTGPPQFVGQHEQAVPRHASDFLVDDAPLREGVIATQHVADPIGRHDGHDRRKRPLRTELHTCHGSACVADHLLSSSSDLINFASCQMGSGLFGTNGSVLTSVVVTMASRIAPHAPGRKRYALLHTLRGASEGVCRQK